MFWLLLLPRSDGRLWLGSEGHGLFEWDGHRFINLTERDDLPRGPVYALTAQNQNVWVGSHAGLFYCRKEGCRVVEQVPGIAVRGLLLSQNPEEPDTLWLATEEGLAMLKGASTPFPSYVRVPVSLRLPTLSLAQTQDAQHRFSLWVGASRGVAKIQGSETTLFQESDGFPMNYVPSLLATRDRHGNPVLWASVFQRGIVKILEDGRFTLFDHRHGLPEDYVYGMMTTGSPDASRLWLGTASSGVARLDGDSRPAFTTRDGLPHDVVVGIGETVFPDQQVNYWVGTIAGLVRLREERWESYSLGTGSSPEMVYDLVSDTGKSGLITLWAATGEGLRRFRNGQWKSFPLLTPNPSDGLITDLQIGLSPSGKKILWASSFMGVLRVDEEKIEVFDQKSAGLPSNKVFCLAETGSPKKRCNFAMPY